MKLSTGQKKNIISAYAAGGVSMATLAVKYGVSTKTISKVISTDKDFPQKVKKVKKEAETAAALSMTEFILSRSEKAQGIIDEALEMAKKRLNEASLRDLMGTVKILREGFAIDHTAENASKQALDRLCAAIKEGVGGE